jgi:hypothetical protein
MRAATYSYVSILLLFVIVTPAGANVKGRRGSNGQHTRPFYIFAHNPNQIDGVENDVDRALAAGANALEPDIMRFSDTAVYPGPCSFGLCNINATAGPAGLFVYHDHVGLTTRKPSTVEDYFEYLHSKIEAGANIALVVLDIKTDAATSTNVQNLLTAVHTHLNYGDVLVNVIYSVGSISDLRPLLTIDRLINDNEGLQVDGENGPDAAGAVFNDLVNGGMPHPAFGDGSFGISGLGLTGGLDAVDIFAPGVVPSIDFASWFRAGGFGGFWDSNQYINGGTGVGFAIPYAYPIPIDTPPNIGYLALAFMNQVDGLIADSDEQPQNFDDTVANIRYLRQPVLYPARVLCYPS